VKTQAVFFCIVVGGSLKMIFRLITIGVTNLFLLFSFAAEPSSHLAAKVIAAVDGSPTQTPTFQNRHIFDEARQPSRERPPRLSTDYPTFPIWMCLESPQTWLAAYYSSCASPARV
jgi:hypothetical protein